MPKKPKGVVIPRDIQKKMEQQYLAKREQKDFTRIEQKTFDYAASQIAQLQNDMFTSFAYALRNVEKYGHDRLERNINKALEYYFTMQLRDAPYHFTAKDVEETIKEECDLSIVGLIEAEIEKYWEESERLKKKKSHSAK